MTTKPSVETAQVEFELDQLLTLFRESDPARILEVGVWHGGTLWHWLQGGRTVVAVDDTCFEADDWYGWAAEAQSSLQLLQGNSRDPDIIQSVAEAGPYEFVFIDAAHDYQSVKGDWENYGAMVAEGGMVAFHDIAPRAYYGVSDLWAKLKPGRRTVEIWSGADAYCGIGVIWPT